MRCTSIVIGCALTAIVNSMQVQAQVECPLGWAPGPLFPDLQGANGPVHAILTYDPPGALAPTLIVGGEFTRIGNIAANNIASWDGTIWRPLGDGATGPVRALTNFNSNLIVGGDFDEAGTLGITSRHIAGWNGTEWLYVGNGLGALAADGSVTKLAVFNGQLIAGGSVAIAGTSTNIVRLNGSIWEDISWPDWFASAGNPGFLEVFDEDGPGPVIPLLYCNCNEGLGPGNIQRWNGTIWVDNPDHPSFGIHASTVTNEGLVIAGRFSGIWEGGFDGDWSDMPGIAVWDGESFSGYGDGISVDFLEHIGVTSIRQFGSDLFAAGNFTDASGTAVQNMARFNGSQWISTGFLFSGENYRRMNDMRVHNNELYVGGDFNLLDAFGEVNHLAKYNGATWSSIRTATSVNALATIGSNWLVVGGDFGHVDGLSTTIDPYYLGIWNGKDFNVLGGGVNGPVHALKSWTGVGANVIVAGGEFTMAGSQGGIGSLAGGGNDGSEPANRIAMWTDLLINGGWQPLGNGFNNTVLAVERVSSNTIFNESIYAGGVFTASANGATTFNRVALWDVPSSTWFTMGTGFNGAVRALKGFNVNSFSRDVIAGGDFTTASGVTANRIAIWRAPNQNGWEPLGSGFNNAVYAIERHNGSTYAAGAFTASGATPVNHVARWTGTAWEQVGAGLNGNVYALRSYNGDLFAACEVTVGGGLTVARWNGTSWTSVDSGVTFGAAKAILPFKSELVVGGAFEKAQGSVIESPGLARFRYQGVPWIIRQPTAQSFPCHAPVSFQVDIPTGYEDVMTFQWFKDGQPLTIGWNNTGSFVEVYATGDTLTIQDISDADEGAYHVVFTTSCGSVASNSAALTANVTCPPCPWDIAYGDAGDGYVGVPDLLMIINRWGTTDDRADVSEDGTVGVPDLLTIINHWGVCP